MSHACNKACLWLSLWIHLCDTLCNKILLVILTQMCVPNSNKIRLFIKTPCMKLYEMA